MHARKARTALVALSGAAAIVAAACGGDVGEPDVQVALADFTLVLSTGTAAAGELTFAGTNAGPTTHEFEIFSVPAGVDADALPVESGVADTEGQGLVVIDEVEDIVAGTTAELTVDLEPGGYAVICNLPDHYGQGMHAVLTVE